MHKQTNLILPFWLVFLQVLLRRPRFTSLWSLSVSSRDRKITIFKTNPGWLRLEAPSNEVNTEHGFNTIFKLPYKLLKTSLTTLRENGNPYLKMGKASAVTGIDTLNSSTEAHTKKENIYHCGITSGKLKIMLFFFSSNERRNTDFLLHETDYPEK